MPDETNIQRRDQIINHFRDEDAVAKAFSVALIGDENDWEQHHSNARRFLDAMEQSMLTKAHSR